jgi:hypothetical protein
MPKFPAIPFKQYESSTPDDELIVFVAPAKTIAAWAGIPRKGWHVRMLFQRWITPGREVEVKEFWKRASTPENGAGKKYILGPTALTVAIHGEPVFDHGEIVLDYTSPLDLSKPANENLATIAGITLDSIRPRLSTEQLSDLDTFLTDPLREVPDTDNDYVLQSAMQLGQMRLQSGWFVEKYSISDEQLREMIVALEAIARPAVVVDGQHRLYGAANCDNPIWIPVVAIPRCPWSEQIYQFVVINEKAKPIEASLLTDIFGSSLTREEQRSLREKLSRSRVDVEPRIAAVIASRQTQSPFSGMIRFALQGPPPGGETPYLPESAIRLLIEGGRGARGWRRDDEFYDTYVKPTFPERGEWESWTDGRWQDYWFVFWRTVADFYNDQAQKFKNDPTFLLWDPHAQTNLTKSVTLRLFQSLFMNYAIERVEAVESTREVLEDALGPEKAAEAVEKQIKERAIPPDVTQFEETLRNSFFSKGIPVRFFIKQWKASLDDAQGQTSLRDEMEKAFRAIQEGRRYHTRNTEVFAVGDESEE